jgi:hypothetical protein
MMSLTQEQILHTHIDFFQKKACYKNYCKSNVQFTDLNYMCVWQFHYFCEHCRVRCVNIILFHEDIFTFAQAGVFVMNMKLCLVLTLT